MCYSLESSKNAFIIGSLSCTYLVFVSKDKTLNHIGVFLFTVNLIQFLEYFIWDDLDCNKYNTVATNLIPIVLTLQILSLYLGGYYYQTLKINDNFLLFLSIFLIIVIFYSYFISWEKNICTTTNEDGSLKWGFLHRNENFLPAHIIYYGSFLFLPFFAKDIYKSITILVLGMTTWLYTTILHNSTYTRWCYFSSYIPLAFIIIEIIQKNNISFKLN